MSRDGTHVTVSRVGASRVRNLVVPCVPTPQLPPCVPTPQLPPCAIAHLTPYPLSILTLLAFHHSPDSLSIHLSFPHSPSPILVTFLSMACVFKRFSLTSPRKLSLTCVKRGFLRTTEPRRTSQLSPCSPLMSQCHVYVMPGWDVPCPCAIAPSAPPARELLSCPVSQPNNCHPAQSHISLPTHFPPSPYSLVILSLLTFHTLPTRFPSLSRRTCRHFVVSTPAFSNSSHVSFHGVRTKTFSTHVTT